MKFLSMAALEVLNFTTSGAASDEIFRQNDNIVISVNGFMTNWKKGVF